MSPDELRKAEIEAVALEIEPTIYRYLYRDCISEHNVKTTRKVARDVATAAYEAAARVREGAGFVVARQDLVGCDHEWRWAGPPAVVCCRKCHKNARDVMGPFWTPPDDVFKVDPIAR